jgi:ubiquinone/menaquinone biosynthesis C-methylase UbiE
MFDIEIEGMYSLDQGMPESNPPSLLRRRNLWRSNRSMNKPIGAGASSFELIDSALLFSKLRLKEGMVFLDLACGKGLYAIAVAEAIGEKGWVYAIDLWEEGIAHLRKEILARGIKNIKAMVADVSKKIPLGDNQVDLCLMATVLHDLVRMKAHEGVLREVRRVLNPEGTLAIVEFKKIDGPPGPPLHIRLSPGEVKRILNAYGFEKKWTNQVGPYNYLMAFFLKEPSKEPRPSPAK